jgi:tRNA A37 threonylcarbamoyladenosine modification protein TsaB
MALLGFREEAKIFQSAIRELDAEHGAGLDRRTLADVGTSVEYLSRVYVSQGPGSPYKVVT